MVPKPGMKRIHPFGWAVVGIILISVAAGLYGSKKMRTAASTEKQLLPKTGDSFTVAHVKKLQTTSDWPFIAPRRELQPMLAAAVHSKEYQDGGEFLKKVNLSPSVESKQKLAIHHHLIIDIVRSLSSDQTEVMEKTKKLPFARLTQEQQTILSQLRKLDPMQTNPVYTRMQDSFIRVFLYPANDMKWHLGFEWRVPEKKGESGIFYGALEPRY